MMPRPAAVTWYRAYCYLNVLLNLASIGAGIWMIENKELLGERFGTDWPADVWPMIGSSLMLGGAIFTVGSVVVLMLPNKPWAWVVHLINLIVGVMGCFTALLCIPLLIVWFRPEVKYYYGEYGRPEQPRPGR